MLYLWFKAFHIIFVVAWMASMLIYPRYKIHQLSSQPGEPLFDTLLKASNQLRRVIMSPAIVLVWVFGIGMLVLNPALLSGHWMQVKLLLVVVLSAVHGWFVTLGKRIDAGSAADAYNEVSEGQQTLQKRLRLLNEIPFLLLIGIVILVVVRPF